MDHEKANTADEMMDDRLVCKTYVEVEDAINKAKPFKLAHSLTVLWVVGMCIVLRPFAGGTKLKSH